MAVVAPTADYSGLRPEDVVETARLALLGPPESGHVVDVNTDFLRDGYGRFTSVSSAEARETTRVGW